MVNSDWETLKKKLAYYTTSAELASIGDMLLQRQNKIADLMAKHASQIKHLNGTFKEREEEVNHTNSIQDVIWQVFLPFSLALFFSISVLVKHFLN